MNTQLVEQTNEVMPMGEVLVLVQAAFEADIDQNNLMCDEIERLTSESAFLKLQVKNLTKRADEVIWQNEQLLEARKNDEAKEKDFNKKAEMVQANAEKHMQQLDQALRQEQQSKTKLDDAIFTIAKYKELGSPKQIRDKNKTYQKTIATLQAEKVQIKLAIKTYRHDLTVKDKKIAEQAREIAETGFQKFYSKNGDNLIVYPLLCEAINDGKAQKQVPIWYATDSGIGALYMLNEDGEPARSETPKTGIKPKKETMEVIGTMLRKFARNGNVVHSDDIKMLESL